MNTLVSIVIGIVLNFLGVEIQERKNMAVSKTEATIEICDTQHHETIEKGCELYHASSIKKNINVN